MKKYKLLKVMTSSLGVVGIVGVGTTTIVSCGKKSAGAALTKFIKAAKAESANNVVTNAKPAAANWENLSAKSGDLSIKSVTSKGKVVSIVVKSTSKNEVATFTATYTGSAYTDSVWVCSQAPSNSDGAIHSWADFEVAAKADSAAQMLSQASTQKTSWKASDQIIKYTTPIGNETAKTVTVTLADLPKAETVKFVATYTTNRSFQSSDWSSTATPATVKDNLTFKKIDLSSTTPNFPGSDVKVKIGDITYLGGFGGLWTSTDGTTWTKNTSLVIPNTVKVSSIVKSGKNIFVGTSFNGDYALSSNKAGLFMTPAPTTSSDKLVFTQVASDISDRNVIIVCLLDVNGILFIGSQYGLMSWDGSSEKRGDHFEIISGANSKAAGSVATIHTLKFIDNKIFVGTETNGIWTSDAKGTKFTKNELSPHTKDKPGEAHINFIKEINNSIYAYVGQGTHFVATGLWVSDDKGVTFTQKSLFTNSNQVGNSLDLIKNNLYLSTNQGLYISSGDITGASIKFNISATLGADISVSNVIEHTGTIDTLYAGTNKGLFTSSTDSVLQYFTANTSVPAGNIGNINVIDNHIFVDILNSGDYTT